MLTYKGPLKTLTPMILPSPLQSGGVNEPSM